MDKQTKSFIDGFIREHIKRDMRFGYDLHVECDISKTAQDKLINALFDLDKESIRKAVLDHAQNLIDERIIIVESEDRYEMRLNQYAGGM